RVNPGDVQGFYVYLFGDYGRNEVECLAALCAGESVFFDVGANQGWISLAVASLCPRARVIGFEPDPQMVRENVDMLALNDGLADRVVLRRHAVGASNGRLSFRPAGAENTGAGHLDAEPSATSIGVDCRTIDAVIAETGLHPDVIKIDIEGAELDAL